MIRHVVLLHWKEALSAEQLTKVNTAMGELPKRVPGIKAINYGADLEVFPGNANYVLMIDFDNEADLKGYVDHPAHQELLAEVTGPLLDSWATAQFQL